MANGPSRGFDDYLRSMRRAARPLRPLVRVVKRKVAERNSPTLAWLNRARQIQPGIDDWDDLEANRLRLIEKLVKGKTFLDVGGMYRIAGEMSFAAERAGASRVVLFDGMDPSDEFVAKHKANDSRVEFVQGDLHDPSVIEWLGTFDVVWCTGVIYHTPHPVQQLMHLRRMTKDNLVLGTNVMPDFEGIEQVSVLYAGLEGRPGDVRKVSRRSRAIPRHDVALRRNAADGVRQHVVRDFTVSIAGHVALVGIRCG